MPFPSPNVVTGISNAIALSTVFSHTCVLLGDGTARCWGQNSDDQIGVDKNSSPNEPTPITAPVSRALSTSAGLANTCVVLPGGLVQCWGLDLLLGNGMSSGMDTFVPTTVPGISGATSVAQGAYTAFAIVSGGAIKGWGKGFLGDGNNYSTATPPVDVKGISGATSVSAGSNHACAIVSGGVKCWGDNGFGELGYDGGGVSATPVDVMGMAGVRAIGTGINSTCALLGDGSVQCWGAMPGNDGPTPTIIPGISGATMLAVGRTHECAAASGWVKCWGSNQSGELGNGTTSQTYVLTPVTVTGW
jgi:alpha-tubulin suppressor-like RCC1 family protein